MPEDSPRVGDNVWLTAAQAAAQLGIKPQTLYAYVSRGLLTRTVGSDGRSSRFAAAEVARLAAQGRNTDPKSKEAWRLPIVSAITTIRHERLWYRGRDACALAVRHSFEEVAEFLWSGTLGPVPNWRAKETLLVLGRQVQALLPPNALPLDRLRVVTAAFASADDLRFDLRPVAVQTVGRTLLATMVESLPPHPATTGRPDSPPSSPSGAGESTFPLADLLWRRLSEAPPQPWSTRVTNVALALLADHELAPSTLAARIAAAFGADPYAVVGAGLGALGGVRHGGVSLAAELLLAQMVSPAAATAVIGERLRLGESIPGFGLSLYPNGDPRATTLLALLREQSATLPRWPIVEEALIAMGERGLSPNVDFALAVFTDVCRLIHGAGEAIFAIGRSAGWLAHGLEEYAQRTSFRARAIYVGPTPPS